MDKNKLFTVCASSNLLESNAYWNILRKNYELSFEAYNEFITPLLQKNTSGIIIVLFLEDLIQDFNIDISLIDKQYNSFFQAVEKRALSSNEPIIICLGKNYNQNIINNVKKDNKILKFYNVFLDKLSILKKRFNNIYLLDLNEIFYQYGSNEIYSDRNWYFARCRLSLKGLNVLIHSLSLVIDRISNAASKVLVLDCDNTLWGGVIGEDGIKGITLGQDGIGTAYVDFQKEIINLANSGVIIVLASKNNDNDVWDVFDNHTEMKLKREHIVTSKINWREKALNIEEIAEELNLGLNSFVFWDDNPLERDKMKTLLPQVLTIDVPKEVVHWPRLLRTISNFAKFQITEDDKKKSDQYKSRAKFVNDLKTAENIKSYLTSLKLSPQTFSINDSNIARAEQLCMKTNQFNVRTKRHSASNLQNLKKENDEFVFLIKLNDRYGDHGIVALVCLSIIDEDLIFLDTFLMSCRVLGRHLEAWILSEIIKRIKKKEARYLIAEFVETKRNSIALKFLDKYGFKEIDKESTIYKKFNSKASEITGKIYYLDTKNLRIPNLEIYEKDTK